ncbi:MAG: N-acetylglucosamine kinase [Thermoproteus sp. AZ2]|uniref:N-acetylglucosamine kinase n=1 Tax=Thermoproteus sp. AZ2 TaxID=1609232 RepID=A0ACC6V2S7_9CREN
MVALLGVDSGGTKTEAVLIIDGEVSAIVTAGPSNAAAIGLEAACANIRRALRAAAGVRLDVIGLGSAGYLGGEVGEGLRRCASAEAGAPAYIFEDVEAAHVSAFLFGDGVVGILGTGSNFLGVKSGVRARAGGWGHLLGDEGSAYHVGREAVRAALRELEGLEEESELGKAVRSALGADEVVSLLRAIYFSQDPKGLIASLAPKVFELARRGETKAVKIVGAAAEGAAEYISAIFKRLGGPLPLALTGSLYLNNEDLLAPLISRALSARGYPVEPRRPVIRQSCAAALMAAKAAGLLPSHLLESIKTSCAI